MFSAAGGSLQVISFIFSSLRTYFSPLIPLVTDQDDTIYDPSCLILGLRATHTEGCASTPHPHPQFNISLFFHMQSNRVVDWTDDCEMVGQRVQQPMTTSHLTTMRDLGKM